MLPLEILHLAHDKPLVPYEPLTLLVQAALSKLCSGATTTGSCDGFLASGGLLGLRENVSPCCGNVSPCCRRNPSNRYESTQSLTQICFDSERWIRPRKEVEICQAPQAPNLHPSPTFSLPHHCPVSSKKKTHSTNQLPFNPPPSTPLHGLTYSNGSFEPTSVQEVTICLLLISCK